MKTSVYQQRVDLCLEAIRKATKKLGMKYGVASDYQGVEIDVDTEDGIGKVIVLMITGLGPHYPKHITLVVHGYVKKVVSHKVEINCGGINSSEKDFLPNKISQKWLQDSILKSADGVKAKCTAKNMKRLAQKATALRRQEISESPSARHQTTTLDM